MNNELPNGVYITESREDVEKLKRWEKTKEISEKVSNFARNSFCATLLSPFDIDGPVAEIISGVVWGVAKITEKIAEKNIEKYYCNGADVTTYTR